jgi:dihydrofolate reductase
MKLTVTTFLTLDGVMRGPGGREEDTSCGFDLGGWVVPFADADFGAIVTEQFSGAGAFLFGRATYEMMAAHWPQVTDPDDDVAAKLNKLPKYIVSTSLTSADWTDSTVIGGSEEDVVAAIRALKAAEGGELQVHGSHGLVQTLMAHRLVDEYRLWFFPIVLGRGKRLFGDGTVPTGFERVDTRLTGSGVTVQTLRPTGAPQHGTIVVEDGAGVVLHEPS